MNLQQQLTVSSKVGAVYCSDKLGIKTPSITIDYCVTANAWRQWNRWCYEQECPN